MSSNKLLLFVFIIVMAGLIVGIAYMSKHPKSTLQTQNPNTNQQAVQQNPSPAVSSQTPIIQGGSSNQDLQSDTQSIDNSLNTLNSDLSNVDTGLNDQQTNLQ